MSRRVWLVLTIGVVASLLMSGCATPAPPPAATEAPRPEATPTEAAPPPTQAPREPKVATFIMWQDFIDLAPAYAYASEQVALNNCYENLVYYNPPGSDELMGPGLATSWEKNEDATEWTFHLREGVTFQDGTPFNADAVKATIEYYLAQGGGGCTYIWGPVEGVEVVDDYTVTVHCSRPTPVDLIATSTFCGGMVSPAVVDEPKEWFDAGHCVGTGPYTIESFERGQRLVMTRFEDYWKGWQENQLDKVVFEIVPDHAVGLQMTEGGEADFFSHTPPERVADLDAREQLSVYVLPTLHNTGFFLNTTKPPLDNKLVRQALAYSFPYEDLMERTQGTYTQGRGAIPHAMWGHCEDCLQYHQDMDRARELLAEAGYPDGGFELVVTYTSTAVQQVWPVELWVFPLAELGITLKPQGMTFQSQWELAKSDSPQDIFTGGWYPTWVTPYDFLFTLYHSEDQPTWNHSRWYNPEFDSLIDEGDRLTAIDRDAAEEKFVEAQHILLEECPVIYLTENPVIWAVSADIEGFATATNPAYTHVIFFHSLTTTR